MKKKIFFVLYNLGFLLVGVVIGGYLGFQVVGKPHYNMRVLLAVATHAEYSYFQYLHSEYEPAKSALQEHIKLLEEIRELPSGYWKTPYNYLDSAYSYIRLSKLERERGNFKEADRMRDIAIEKCMQSGSQKCSQKELEEYASKLDERYK